MPWRLLVLLLSLAPAAQSCTCRATSLADAKANADVVFEGTYQGRTWWILGDAVFSVRQVWKGNIRKNFQMEWRQGDRGDCNGFWSDDLKPGTQMLVFAKRGSDGIYRTSICYPTKAVHQVADHIRALGPGRAVR